MAHRVFGIDLGAHTVKVTELHVALRSLRLARVETIDVHQGPGNFLEHSLNALSAILTAAGGVKLDPTDIVAVGMPGDRIILRTYHVPFTDAKKIGQVVSNELADDLPWDEDDVLFDHQLSGGGKDGVVLAAGAPSADLETLLGGLMAHGVDARQILPSPLAYGALVRRLAPAATVAVLDIGHQRTNVALVKDGRVVAARSLLRGGYQLTEAVRNTFQLTHAAADAFKRSEGTLIEPPGVPASHPQHRLVRLLAEQVAGLARDLRHTIELLALRAAVTPAEVLLCGGPTHHEGIDRVLSDVLGLPTRRLTLGDDPELGSSGLPQEGQALAALALSIALEQGRRQTLNLRQGRFSFKRTRSVFRDKLVPLALSLVALALFFSFNVYVSLHRLEHENAALSSELTRVTRRIFGEPLADPQAALRRLRGGLTPKGAGIPEVSATDMLRRISETVPPTSEVKLDVRRLDIRSGRTEMSGTVDTLSAVSAVVEGIKQDTCFDDISTGKISEVADGKKQFSLTMKTSCF